MKLIRQNAEVFLPFHLPSLLTLGQFQVSSGGVQANGNHWDQVGPIEMEILMGMGRS